MKRAVRAILSGLLAATFGLPFGGASAAPLQDQIALSEAQNGNPMYEQAIAASAPTEGARVSQLQHPERFGLVGRLIGHSFYYLGGAALRHVTITVYDKNTIDWHEDGSHIYYRAKGNKIVTLTNSDWTEQQLANPFAYVTWEPVEIAQDRFKSYVHDYRLAYAGDLLGNNDRIWWANLTPEVKRDIARRQEKIRPAIQRELAQVENDIRDHCPNGVTNSDCNDIFRTRTDIRAMLGDDAVDPETERFDAQTRQRVADRNAAAAVQNTAMLGQAMGIVAAGFASRAQASRPAATAYVPTPTASYAAAAAPQPLRAAAGRESKFGPLPSDIGTPAQRQFWAQHCESMINDGSPGAQGCMQSRNSFKASPAVAHAPEVTGGIYAGGASSGSSGSADVPSMHAESCISMIHGTRDTFHNRCGYTIGMTYCVSNVPSHPWACARDRGASDTISAGGNMDGDAGMADQNYNGKLAFRYVACRGGLSALGILRNQGTLGICN